MLDPPISQADIDNKVQFRTRGGGAATVERQDEILKYRWWVARGDYVWAVMDSGLTWSIQEDDFDLISRQENQMESQVIVEDKRHPCCSWQTFEIYESGTILTGGDGSEIYLKVGSDRVIVLTGADAGTCQNAAPTSKCRPLPHLRLRLVLESKS